MKPDHNFMRIVRKLEQAELEHLRAVVTDLQGRLEAAERERDDAIDAAHSADCMAMIFQDSYYEALDRLPDAIKPQIGIDKQGHIGLIEPAQALDVTLEQLG